jgi:acetate kinase
MLILVINCGSSSVKYDLFDLDGEAKDLCRGVVERIGEEIATLTQEVHPEGRIERQISCKDHHTAIEIIKNALTDPREGVLRDVNEVAGVGHRVVHGGEEFNESTLIDDEVIKSIEKFSELAPLHNPPALMGIRGCLKIFKAASHVAVFDTAFHQSMKEHVFCYALPYEMYEEYGIRKYGFHGTSHRYVSMKAAERMGKAVEDVNLITVHLGNGCSMAAVRKGKSIDTSMGFTPLEGLVMGTRSGDIDPAIVTFLMHKKGYDADNVNRLLNKQSGLLGLSCLSNDMRDILKGMSTGNERAELAYKVFLYRIKKYIGSYAAVLGKVDAVVFTAGIGENVPQIKDVLEEELKPLMSGTEFMIVGTNEELLIAKDTYNLIKRKVNVD